MINFSGWEIPKKNFVEVPHLFWELKGLTPHEKIVLLYILRHTWGFQEYGIVKKITIDEFCEGRKYSDGSRMDSGCEMSRSGVYKALQRLEELKYIITETDDRDKARIKKSYMLNMSKDDVRQKNSDSTQKTQDILDSNRTEKETIERNLEKDSSQNLSVSSTPETEQAVKSDSQKSFTEEQISDITEAVQEAPFTPKVVEDKPPLKKRTNFKKLLDDNKNKEIVVKPNTVKPKTEKEELADEWTLAMLEGIGYSETALNAIKATGQKITWKFKKEAGQAKNIRNRLQEFYPDIDFKPSIITDVRDWLLTDKSRNFTTVGYGGILTHCLDYVGTVYLKHQQQNVKQENLVVTDDIYDKYANYNGEE